MKNIELLESFELELNKLDDNFTKPTTNTTEYFLNAGLDKFWKTRYSQNNPKVKGFEQIQKRIDDLRTLVAEVTLVPDTTSKDLYTVTIPEDYVILLGLSLIHI